MLPCGFQQLLDEPARILDVGGGPNPMAPSASAAERTADRSAYSASPSSWWSNAGASGSEYTVQDSAPDSVASSVSSESA